MVSFLHAFCLLSVSHLVNAQSAVVPDLGILQLVTPTTHASQVAATALATLSIDAIEFYASYIQVDPFNLALAIIPVIESHLELATTGSLISVYADAPTSLLNNPTSYLSRLHASASPYPSAFSSSLMSQATGILLGYESLVSQDVLSMTPSFGPITPGISVAVGPAVTSASTTGSGMGATQASQGIGTAASTSSSKAAGVPVVTASPLLVINAVAAGAALLGVALM